MTVNIYILSSFRVSPDLKSNDPAISSLSEGFTEVEGAEQVNNGSKTDVRRVSDAPSNATLVGAGSLVEHPQWIAGVGDIVGAADWTDKSQRSNSRYYSFKSVGTSLDPKGLAVQRCAKPARSPRHREKENNARSALQQHCDFWDTDGDGLIYPWDIYKGFHRLGFHFTLCLWAAVTMAICASYNTHTSYIPHPLLAINLNNINSNRHGSSTGTYDMDGELDERRFEAIFQKYARGKDYLTLWSVYNLWRNQRCGLDFFGWFAGGLEWIAMYILLWPEDGVMSKEDVRGVYDGSIFYKIAEQQVA